LPNVDPYIYDVSISSFTRSSIYIYDISSLRVNIIDGARYIGKDFGFENDGKFETNNNKYMLQYSED